MRLSKFLIFGLLIASVFVLIPVDQVQAQQQQNVCTGGLVPCGQIQVDPATGQSFVPNPCQLCHIFCLINNIIQFVLICLVPPIALAMLVIGALVLMFAGGSPGLMARAKSIFKSVIIGLFITYAAWLLVNAFLTMIGVQNWTGLRTWFQPAINCPGCGAGAPGPGQPPQPGCSIAAGDECENNSDCGPGEVCNQTTCTCEPGGPPGPP